GRRGPASRSGPAPATGDGLADHGRRRPPVLRGPRYRQGLGRTGPSEEGRHSRLTAERRARLTVRGRALEREVLVRFRKYAVVASVLLLCLLLLTIQTRGGGSGRLGDLVAVVVTPVQSFLMQTHRAALGVWQSYVDWKSVRSENVRLRAESEELRLRALQVEETREENARLRRLLALHERLPLSTLAGEVIGREAGGGGRALTVTPGRPHG